MKSITMPRVVLFIQQRYLDDPDREPMDPPLATFRPLTDNHPRLDKYFLIVAALFTPSSEGSSAIKLASWCDGTI
jgi:hypothetical protein